MSDKLTRRELRHDWLIDHAVVAWLWMRDHVAVVVGGFAVVVLGIALVTGLSRHSKSEGREVEEAFAAASLEYSRGSFQTAAVAFDNFVGRFGGSALAGEAMLRGASSHLFAGNPRDARTLFQRYLDANGGKDAFMDRAARHGIAACMENDGDTAGALAIYRELAAAAGNPTEKSYHLKAAARSLEVLGQYDEAVATYREILTPAGGDQPTQSDPTVERALVELQARRYLAGDRSKPFSMTDS